MRLFSRTLSTMCATTLLLLPFSAAQAQVTSFFAYLNGLNENPPNGSPATGTTTVTLNQTLSTLRVQVTFFGLVAPNSATHIHCCIAPPGNAGVATTTPTFPGFPTGATAGSYDQLFDMTLASSWNPAYITANGGTTGSAFAALSAGMLAGNSYLNVHSTAAGGGFPGGEIRGFLLVTPEPGTYALMASGLIALGLVARKRRKA